MEEKGMIQDQLQTINLEIKVPAFFQCPISLDLMHSPVSLCTGVTYDRASIQRWLDSGNKTCPATNQLLPSTDLVPNLTLRRLIHLWSATSMAAVPLPNAKIHAACNLIRDLRSSCDPFPLLRRLADFFLLADVDGFEKNAIAGRGLSSVVFSVFVQNAGRIETLEAAAKIISIILAADFIDESNKKTATSFLLSDLNPSVSALLSILKEGKTPGGKADAARITCAILLSLDSESKASIAEKSDLIPALIHLIREENTDRETIDAGITCLAAICEVRRARQRMVKEGLIPAAVKVLTTDSPTSTTEKAIVLLEAAAGIAEGRSEICENGEECLGAVLEKMMKVGREGMEAAVAVLWTVCIRFHDRLAVEAVSAASGGVTKILLLLQSNCSPAVRQMSGELLKIFRVNNKSCLAGYDTKTTHIMPF